LAANDDADLTSFGVTKKIYCIDKRPPPRTLHTAFFFRERMYIYGGYDSLVGILTDMWAVNIDYPVDPQLSWEKIDIVSDCPKTFRHSSHMVDDSLFIIGGKLSASINTSQLWRLNLLEDIFGWEKLDFVVKDEDDESELQIDSATTVDYKDRIWLFGGFLGGSLACYTNNLWNFDYKSYQLKQVDPEKMSGKLPEPRVDHAAALMGNKMFIFGGSRENIIYDD
jgi:hypothetical protein